MAAGLTAGTLSDVEFAGASSEVVEEEFTTLVRGMAGRSPSVTVVGVEDQGERAQVRLRHTWRFPGVPTAWTYETTGTLAVDDGRWKSTWSPGLVHPGLDGGNRLTSRRVAAERGELLGQDAEPIVTRRAVVRIGIDKTTIDGVRVADSAARLARLVGIDPVTYADKVTEAGPQAFVEAITFRAKAEDRPSNEAVYAIPGALPIRSEQMLAPNRDFARPIIGSVGEASEEIVQTSLGAVVAGDQVGLSGLQRRYDPQLRGTPGAVVQLVDAAIPPAASSASPSAPTSPSATPSTPPREPVTVFEAKPTRGQSLTTTLSLDLQTLAESTLADVTPASAIVAVRPSSGAVVAAASSAGGQGNSVATVGQLAPGSTFKVVSALALMRTGLRPESSVTCSPTVTVDGRRFENYDDYPAAAVGDISFETAFAQSCNTAFIAQRDRLEPTGLQQAASSLGLGTDYDIGFPSYFGSVPAGGTETERAAAMIGQGDVQASPLAMAAVAASVVAGETVVPHLIADARATPQAKPLTAAEASALRRLMTAVVTEGSGAQLGDLPGPTALAKTGTAEYGAGSPLKTHAWMLGAQDDLAVAVFVNDGESGSRTASPLLEQFLRGAR